MIKFVNQVDVFESFETKSFWRWRCKVLQSQNIHRHRSKISCHPHFSTIETRPWKFRSQLKLENTTYFQYGRHSQSTHRQDFLWRRFQHSKQSPNWNHSAGTLLGCWSSQCVGLRSETCNKHENYHISFNANKLQFTSFRRDVLTRGKTKT